MRPFEILLLLSLAAFVLYLPRRRAHPLLSPLLSVVSSILLLAHLLLEGLRWQLTPAYALAVIVYLWGLVRLLRPRDAEITSASRLGRLGLALAVVAGLLIVVATAAIGWLLPVFSLPAPTGPHAVGTTTLRLMDTDRLEDLTPAPDDRRELAVQVWYPAAPDPAGKAESYWPDATRRGPLLADILGLPAFVFDHLALVRTHSYAEAAMAVAGEPFPVLVFSHGYVPGYVNQNTAQFEALASHGYVIISVAHPYEALAVTLPADRLVPYSQAQRERFGADNANVAGLLAAATAAEPARARRAALREILAETPAIEASLRRWAADTSFVLDQLPALNATEGAFLGRLDLERIGLWGMSFGGATSFRVCLTDARCQAAANLDGFQFGLATLDAGLGVPALMMYSEPNAGMNQPMLDLATGPVYELTVAGSTHYNFMDFTLASPLFRWLGFVGEVDGARMSALTTDYVRAFFDQTLRGRLSPLLTGPAEAYPEVSFSTE
jgi:predicted dienelactone hydrolase